MKGVNNVRKPFERWFDSKFCKYFFGVKFCTVEILLFYYIWKKEYFIFYSFFKKIKKFKTKIGEIFWVSFLVDVYFWLL
jgi:hypothetical protein